VWRSVHIGLTDLTSVHLIWTELNWTATAWNRIGSECPYPIQFSSHYKREPRLSSRSVIACFSVTWTLLYVPRSRFKSETAWPTLKVGDNTDLFIASNCCRFYSAHHSTAGFSSIYIKYLLLGRNTKYVIILFLKCRILELFRVSYRKITCSNSRFENVVLLFVRVVLVWHEHR